MIVFYRGCIYVLFVIACRCENSVFSFPSFFFIQFLFFFLLLINYLHFQGNKIHAIVWRNMIYKFEKDLKEGKVYFGVALQILDLIKQRNMTTNKFFSLTQKGNYAEWIVYLQIFQFKYWFAVSYYVIYMYNTFILFGLVFSSQHYFRS